MATPSRSHEPVLNPHINEPKLVVFILWGVLGDGDGVGFVPGKGFIHIPGDPAPLRTIARAASLFASAQSIADPGLRERVQAEANRLGTASGEAKAFNEVTARVAAHA